MLWNYLAWHIHMTTDAAKKADFAAAARQVEVEPPADLGLDPAVPPDKNSPDYPYIQARCLTAMRKRMNQDINAHILLGGRLIGYSGIYPCLVEEADVNHRGEIFRGLINRAGWRA